MLRKGFTLIELLIVITIIAILAGAAIPYVADYIEDGRAARAKQDMTEIRNAMVRWELDRGAWPGGTSIEPLVGPFLSKLLIDPWGFPYYVDDLRSEIRSFGRDGVDDSGANDDYTLAFRPPMACTKVEYLDVDGSANLSTGDTYTFFFTRPVGGSANLAAVTVGGVGLDTAAEFGAPVLSGKTATVALGAGPFTIAGNDVVITHATGDGFRDNDPDFATEPLAWAKDATLKVKSAGF